VAINDPPFALPGFAITQTRNEDYQLIIEAKSNAQSALCPNCQQASMNRHGWYSRQPQDLPCIGRNVRLHLTVRRFVCLNPACAKKTFVERFPDWLPIYARRTERLTAVMRRVGFEVSAESARRIFRCLQITTSGDTVLRVVKRTPVVNNTLPRVVGLDDWAIRKGHRYGSIIIDQETNRVVELVKGRLAEDIQPWFEAHPQVEIVTRDRSADYRKGLTIAAPQAIQIADRFHLLMNLRQLAQRVGASAYNRLKKLPVPADIRPKCPVFARSNSEQKRMEASRQQRLDLYNEVQRLKAEGVSIGNLSLHLHRNYYTLRTYYHAEIFPERMPGRTPHSILSPYVDYLDQRFEAGCTSQTQLFKEIQAQGYPGSTTVVGRWLKAKRILAGENPVTVRTGLEITSSSTILPSNYKLSWLLVLDPDKLDEDDKKMLAHIRTDAIIHNFYDLAQDFRKLLKDRSVPALDAWLETADHSSLKTVRNFSKSLRDEYIFIRAALEHEWSNGQSEGQVNRLKFIKRQMYGRASFELLRQKVLYYPGST
jgi:transposase